MATKEKDMNLAIKIAEKIHEKNGATFLVGGIVRDEIMGISSKDVDIEIFGIDVPTLENILKSFGTVNKVGSSFGVYNIKGYDIDIALPRTERKVGIKHKDFEVTVDPFMSYKEASKRRDVRINSIYKNLLTNEYVDEWNGIQDIYDKKIRYVDAETFIEDPLRVLRVAQFSARFGFDIDNETMLLCQKIDLSSLSKERVFEETKKALLRSPKPSIYFERLREMNQLSIYFKELEALIGIPQNPTHHAEGDVWEHTMLVLNKAAELKDKSSNALYFMFAALLHDIGKSVSTKIVDGKIVAYEHDITGEPLVYDMLIRLTNEKKLIQYCKNMTKMHMKPNMYFSSMAKLKNTRKMFYESIQPNDLILLAKADANGRKSINKNNYDENEKFLLERLKDYNQKMKEPMVTGEDLIRLGMKPSSKFKEYLKEAIKLHFSNQNKEQVLKYFKSKLY